MHVTSPMVFFHFWLIWNFTLFVLPIGVPGWYKMLPESNLNKSSFFLFISLIPMTSSNLLLSASCSNLVNLVWFNNVRQLEVETNSLVIFLHTYPPRRLSAPSFHLFNWLLLYAGPVGMSGTKGSCRCLWGRCTLRYVSLGGKWIHRFTLSVADDSIPHWFDRLIDFFIKGNRSTLLGLKLQLSLMKAGTLPITPSRHRYTDR